MSGHRTGAVPDHLRVGQIHQCCCDRASRRTGVVACRVVHTSPIGIGRLPRMAALPPPSGSSTAGILMGS
jgi:hypothetical protein